MAACGTVPPTPHSVWPPLRPRHSDIRESWVAARAESPAAASWRTAPPPPLPAAASRGSPRAAAAPRALRARGPGLLRPSGGPAENLGPARPFLAACETGRSYALLFLDTASGPCPTLDIFPTLTRFG